MAPTNCYLQRAPSGSHEARPVTRGRGGRNPSTGWPRRPTHMRQQTSKYIGPRGGPRTRATAGAHYALEAALAASAALALAARRDTAVSVGVPKVTVGGGSSVSVGLPTEEVTVSAAFRARDTPQWRPRR